MKLTYDFFDWKLTDNDRARWAPLIGMEALDTGNGNAVWIPANARVQTSRRGLLYTFDYYGPFGKVRMDVHRDRLPEDILPEIDARVRQCEEERRERVQRQQEARQNRMPHLRGGRALQHQASMTGRMEGGLVGRFARGEHYEYMRRIQAVEQEDGHDHVIVNEHGVRGASGRRGQRNDLVDAIRRGLSVSSMQHEPEIEPGTFAVGSARALEIEYNRGPSEWAQGQMFTLNIETDEWQVYGWRLTQCQVAWSHDTRIWTLIVPGASDPLTVTPDYVQEAGGTSLRDQLLAQRDRTDRGEVTRVEPLQFVEMPPIREGQVLAWDGNQFIGVDLASEEEPERQEGSNHNPIRTVGSDAVNCNFACTQVASR